MSSFFVGQRVKIKAHTEPGDPAVTVPERTGTVMAVGGRGLTSIVQLDARFYNEHSNDPETLLDDGLREFPNGHLEPL